ncbi:MAG: hypothetical protein KTR15_08995 [Phycisphaeraceae bacterium]|nr:hypothetical protein [Phycisphaeraceae bacterium]
MRRRIYCKHCGYSLRGIESDTCPECGEAFDVEDPNSYIRFAIRELPGDIWLTLGMQAAVFVLVSIGLLLRWFGADVGFLGYRDGSYSCFVFVLQIAAMFCGAASVGLHYKHTVPGYRRRLLAVAAVPWFVVILAVLAGVAAEVFL